MKQKMEGTQENVLVVDTKKKKDKKKNNQKEGQKRLCTTSVSPR